MNPKRVPRFGLVNVIFQGQIESRERPQSVEQIHVEAHVVCFPLDPINTSS